MLQRDQHQHPRVWTTCRTKMALASMYGDPPLLPSRHIARSWAESRGAKGGEAKLNVPSAYYPTMGCTMRPCVMYS
jgi:hypothetical protein